MSKIDLDTLASGYQSTTSLNDNFQSIEDELNNKVLYRDNPDGEANEMLNDLDMNSQRMLNLPSATSRNEPATYGQLLDAASGITSITTLSEEQTASSDGQSLFTFTSITYTPGAKNLTVYRNGTKLPISSYTETSTSSITLSAANAAAIKAGDEFEFIVNQRDVDSDTYLASNATYTPAGSGATTSDVQTKLRERRSLKDFGATGDGVTDDTSAVQAALTAGGRIWVTTGNYVVGALSITTPVELVGDGKGESSFTAKSSIGQNNMFSASTVDDIKVEGIKFDMRNDIITPSLSNEALENCFHFTSCSNVTIKECEFTRDIARSIRFNGTALNECENIIIKDNEFSSGAKGGVQVRRYGRNVKVLNNRLTNTVDSSHGGSAFEKPIDVSGTIGVIIDGNYVDQDNGDGGSIIVEYIDRQSENVRITNNVAKGADATGNNIKVGASVDVLVANNDCEDAGAIGIFIEGCYDYTVKDNYIKGSGKNGIKVATDSDTTRDGDRGVIDNNTIEDCNGNSAALGAPVSGGASTDSFAIAVTGTADRVSVSRNRFRDTGTTFNGIIIAATNYQIRDNDFTDLASGRITIDNSNSSGGTTWEIVGNVQARTFDTGSATISSGVSFETVTPDTVVEQSSNCFFGSSLRDSALNSTAVYWSTYADANSDFRIQLRDSSHAAVNASADLDFSWWFDATRVANGIFGKTV